MTLDPFTSLSSIKSELEHGWKLFDDKFAQLGPGDWMRKFNGSWTYAELPYHLAYFDRTMGRSVLAGAKAAGNDLMHLHSIGDINEWNKREFAKRGPAFTADDALAAMRESRATIRQWIDTHSDADLKQRAWMPLLFGWVTAGDVLRAIIIHNVAEYWKLWLRTGKQGPLPSPAAIHLRLGFMMNFMPISLNKQAAAGTTFTMTWNFTGPGGGPWTLAVKNGACTVSPTAAPNPDLVITMKPEDFHRLLIKMTPPPLLMLTGAMKVKGLLKMGRFGKLFPEPKPGDVLTPPAMPSSS